MKILIAGLVENIQLVRLSEEGKKRGHMVEGCYASDLVIDCDKDSFNPYLVDGRKLEEYDLIYSMVGSKRRWEWYTVFSFLNEKYKTTIINEKTIAKDYNYFLSPALDYLKQTQNDLPYPKSAIVFNAKGAREAIKSFTYPLIVKSSAGRQGRGVFLCKNFEDVLSAIEEVHKGGVEAVVIREFIPNDGDLRILTVGYRAIGAMKRSPTKEGEFRSNISLGGRGEKFELENYPEIKSIAEKAAEVMKTEIAGVDIIIHQETSKPYILEINPSPQFEGFEKYTGVNAAEKIIEYFEERRGKKR